MSEEKMKTNQQSLRDLGEEEKNGTETQTSEEILEK